MSRYFHAFAPAVTKKMPFKICDRNINISVSLESPAIKTGLKWWSHLQQVSKTNKMVQLLNLLTIICVLKQFIQDAWLLMVEGHVQQVMTTRISVPERFDGQPLSTPGLTSDPSLQVYNKHFEHISPKRAIYPVNPTILCWELKLRTASLCNFSTGFFLHPSGQNIFLNTLFSDTANLNEICGTHGEG